MNITLNNVGLLKKCIIVFIASMFFWGCKKEEATIYEINNILTSVTPFNNSTEIPLNTLVSWEQSYCQSNVKYNFYLDSILECKKCISENMIENEILLNDLQENTSYYWKVDVLSDDCTKTTSHIYSFTTILDSVEIDSVSTLRDTSGYYLFEERFEFPLINNVRRIWAYLPPDYYSTNKNYPVAYVHDGQTLFDTAISWLNTEWQLDERLDNLFSQNGFGMIVIGIDATNLRRDEFYPWQWEGMSYGGLGDAYLESIVEVLKPEVDKRLRTLPDRANTIMAGSSSGGYITNYAMLKYSDVFSKYIILSPSYFPTTPTDIYEYAEQNGNIKDAMAYFYIGGQENLWGSIDDVIDALLTAGFPSENIKREYDATGVHMPRYWGPNFIKAIEWFYNMDGM